MGVFLWGVFCWWGFFFDRQFKVYQSFQLAVRRETQNVAPYLFHNSVATHWCTDTADTQGLSLSQLQLILKGESWKSTHLKTQNTHLDNWYIVCFMQRRGLRYKTWILVLIWRAFNLRIRRIGFFFFQSYNTISLNKQSMLSRTGRSNKIWPCGAVQQLSKSGPT